MSTTSTTTPKAAPRSSVKGVVLADVIFKVGRIHSFGSKRGHEQVACGQGWGDRGCLGGCRTRRS
jgi:hypothetical protein